ncbi:MAG: hypothetical protein AAGD92_05740 [Pseudomonadota bacterium]
MRFILIGLLLAVWPVKAAADIEVRAEYHAPTDLFALMDGVSGWLFNDPAYHEYWEERFGWSREDQAIVNRYKRYRDRTFNDCAQNDNVYRARTDGIFGTRSSVSSDTDPLAEHFVASQSIEEALANLEQSATSEDAAMLRSFYNHFEPKWRQLLNESKSYNIARAETLHKQLNRDQLDAFLARMTQFYGVDDDLDFTARYVWWPPINRSIADITGRTFFLRNHPDNYPDQSHIAGDVIHEAVHYVSAFQPSAQKVALTEDFLEICPARVDGTVYDLLEEPMATAWGNAAFTKYALGQTLDPAKQWYRRALPDTMARLVWLHVDEIYETDDTINDGIIIEAAKHCAALLETSKRLKRESSWFGRLEK